MMQSHPTQADIDADKTPMQDEAIHDATMEHMRSLIQYTIGPKLLLVVDELVNAYGTGLNKSTPLSYIE
jgi:hypothetical protein